MCYHHAGPRSSSPEVLTDIADDACTADVGAGPYLHATLIYGLLQWFRTRAVDPSPPLVHVAAEYGRLEVVRSLLDTGDP